VLEGHDAAVMAVIDWIERHTHCQYRINGEVYVLDANGIAATVFRQHTSRVPYMSLDLGWWSAKGRSNAGQRSRMS
jgi:hypothetical protein